MWIDKRRIGWDITLAARELPDDQVVHIAIRLGGNLKAISHLHRNSVNELERQRPRVSDRVRSGARAAVGAECDR